MSILVVYASKHGATRGIAERITRTFQRLGMEAEFQPADAVTNLQAHSAVVIGSAIYYGSWMKDAMEFVGHNRATLAKLPVWLFSSGPLGVEVKDEEPQPKDLSELQKMLNPRDHHIFFGALDPDKLTFMERMVVKGIHAPVGDYRDWNEIEDWTAGIVHALAPAGVTPSEL